MYIYIYIHTTHTHTYIYIYMYTHMLYIYTYICICPYVYTCVWKIDSKILWNHISYNDSLAPGMIQKVSNGSICTDQASNCAGKVGQCCFRLQAESEMLGSTSPATCRKPEHWEAQARLAAGGSSAWECTHVQCPCQTTCQRWGISSSGWHVVSLHTIQYQKTPGVRPHAMWTVETCWNHPEWWSTAADQGAVVWIVFLHESERTEVQSLSSQVTVILTSLHKSLCGDWAMMQMTAHD